MERRVTPPKRVTSPTWSPPLPCKEALRLEKYCITTFYLSNRDLFTKTFLTLPTLTFQGDFGKRAAYHFGSGIQRCACALQFLRQMQIPAGRNILKCLTRRSFRYI